MRFFLLISATQKPYFYTMKQLILGLLILFAGLSSKGQADSYWVRKMQYIKDYKELAIDEMKRYKVPASITLAQGIIETDAGKSLLARVANNHFGIKCHKEWTGKTFHQDDDAKNECFRSYGSVEESYRDHSLFLTTRQRYQNLFTLSITDYKAWAYGLKAAGYATNPAYPEKLIKIIEEHQLMRFDDPMYIETNSNQNAIVSTTADTIMAYLEQPEETHLLEYGPDERPVYETNGKKYIIYSKYDTPARIAQLYDLFSWQLNEFNDLPEDAQILPGEIVYLQRKARKGEQDFYTVKPGETMRSISQKLGIRINKLYYRNRLKDGENPKEGTTLWLRKRKPSSN